MPEDTGAARSVRVRPSLTLPGSMPDHRSNPLDPWQVMRQFRARKAYVFPKLMGTVEKATDSRWPRWVTRTPAPLSTVGLIVGTLFFAASLTPSLVPRAHTMQGVLSGLSLAAGYGVGVFGRWFWQYLELPVPGRRARQVVAATGAVLCLVLAFGFLRQASEWQNAVRELMAMETVESARPFRVGLIAASVFAAIILCARVFHFTFRMISERLHRHVPRRISHAVGILVAITLFWSVIDGVLLRWITRAMDTSFQQFDALIQAELAPPTDPVRTGSRESHVDWRSLGRAGRGFVSSGPGMEELRAFFGGEVVKPIRVYVGLNSAEEIESRARLALEELKRTGAFERSVLVIATPTGTGWLDPSAIDTLEYLHRGAVATVAVQYSYLPSWLSLLSEAEYGVETARAVFREVYGYWTRLPRDGRPRLYLHGLSLGALNSERSADIYDMIADPFQGAVWSGPPFRSATWRTVTAQREPGTPAWLPRFRDSSIVRFTHQHNALDIPGAKWGPIRIIYLQYASDPVTFFEPEALFRQPAWMSPPRGPDVSPHLRWFPVVTMLQLAIDLAAGHRAPMGYGHVYAPEHYIDAWFAVTAPPGWTPEEIERLKGYFLQQRQTSEPLAE
jgi:uncharacterized membrane protein